MKERCRCGNRVPAGELDANGGLCMACAREKTEKVEAEEDRRHLRELQDRYLWAHPFYRPEG